MELMDFEREDSGIDSDAEVLERQRRRPLDDFMQLSEASDYEVDPRLNSPRYHREFWQKLEEEEHIFPHVDERSSTPWPDANSSSPTRISPPLYEVELTASDEEEEGSVLELVIPVRSPRYPRVTPSKLSKIKPKCKFLSMLLCCFRKK